LPADLTVPAPGFLSERQFQRQGSSFWDECHHDCPIPVISALWALAFTVAPHLQTINYRGRFSRFVGI